MVLSAESSASDFRALILATSLKPSSRSYLLAREAHARVQDRGVESTLIWLREFELPLCSATPESREHSNTLKLKAEVEKATHVLFASPVYNFDLNAAAKNAMELAGRTIEGKTVGFLCAAGGSRSYMSVMSFANSLMLDFRCWIVPRFVYATKGDFSDDAVSSETILERIEQLVEEMFSRAPVKALAVSGE